jgi:hypothetical protein
MSKEVRLYRILEDMIELVERGNSEEVMRLNREYSLLAPEVYETLPSELNLLYDRCVNDCVLLVGIFAENSEELIADAKKCFARIPRPD